MAVTCAMRRNVQPSFPSEMICCFFYSLKTLLMLSEAIGPLARVNVPGFIVGRFWVITEEIIQSSTNLIFTRHREYSAVSRTNVSIL